MTRDAIPPLLTGVGDKLRLSALESVLRDAAVARPYMDARMPQFGASNLHELAANFAAADTTSDHVPAVHDTVGDAKKAGYQLVHANALTCVSCHMFNRQKSLGIQAMDLTVMAERLATRMVSQVLARSAEVSARHTDAAIVHRRQ